eukprot:354782-Chlamydomonas_euryale.AAC.1
MFACTRTAGKRAGAAVDGMQAGGSWRHAVNACGARKRLAPQSLPGDRTWPGFCGSSAAALHPPCT